MRITWVGVLFISIIVFSAGATISYLMRDGADIEDTQPAKTESVKNNQTIKNLEREIKENEIPLLTVEPVYFDDDGVYESAPNRSDQQSFDYEYESKRNSGNDDTPAGRNQSEKQSAKSNDQSDYQKSTGDYKTSEAAAVDVKPIVKSSAGTSQPLPERETLETERADAAGAEHNQEAHCKEAISITESGAIEWVDVCQ